MTDPIADMLTRIRNASMVNKPEVVVSFSKIKLEIAKILEKEGFIAGVENVKSDELFTQGHLVISLKYTEENTPVIRSIQRASKPGQRYYVKKDKIAPVLSGLGISILTTPQGVMTGAEARKKGVGGEVLVTAY